MTAGDHWHEHFDETDGSIDPAVQDAIWQVDNVELTTVGIDIGSATSHLMFSWLHLRRRGQEYSSRFVVVERKVLYRSRILLTPYLPSGLIDAEALDAFFHAEYEEAGIDRDAVDAGAVILTGVALERPNASRIAELFAAEGGRFVCASAGHNMEAVLAAYGSGAVERSSDGETVLCIDVGGGTTKFALCSAGEVTALMAKWGGARLVSFGDDGRIERVESPLVELADQIGVTVEPGSVLDDEGRRALADAIAQRVITSALGGDDGAGALAGSLPAEPVPQRIVFSGGVAEYMRPDGPRHPGDLGPELAAALAQRVGEIGIAWEPASERIRATVIGASQFSMQVSGNTIHISGEPNLPIHNVPIVALDLTRQPEWSAATIRELVDRRVEQLDLGDRSDPVGIALNWTGDPLYLRLKSLADGIAAAHLDSPRREAPLILILEADVGASLGAILAEESGLEASIIAIDGIELSDLDFVDIGQQIEPSHVVPVVIKSLIFSHTTERPRILGRA